jgi:selenoprotein W-related protein
MDLFKRKVRRFVLVPSDGGRFEVSIGGELVYSKLETGVFPEPRDIVKEVETRLKAAKR